MAGEVGACAHTVGKWRVRFAEDRFAGLRDEPRSGAPRTVTDERVAELLVRTLEAAPENAACWSTRSMAAACGLSPATVHRVWRAFGLRPHRVETFELSSDPGFVEKVRDIVGLYLAPPDRALVLCVDEKTEMRAVERTRPLLPMRPGRAERRTSNHTRHGTCSLFAALDVVVGRVIGRRCRRHRAKEFRHFLEAVDAAVPPGPDVHLVLDNASIHKAPPVRDWLAKRPRYHLHFTPAAGSWLNQVERSSRPGSSGAGCTARSRSWRRRCWPTPSALTPSRGRSAGPGRPTSDPRQRRTPLLAYPRGARARFEADFRDATRGMLSRVHA